MGGGGGPFFNFTGETSFLVTVTAEVFSGFFLVSLDFTALKDAAEWEEMTAAAEVEVLVVVVVSFLAEISAAAAVLRLLALWLVVAAFPAFVKA